MQSQDDAAVEQSATGLFSGGQSKNDQSNDTFPPQHQV